MHVDCKEGGGLCCRPVRLCSGIPGNLQPLYKSMESRCFFPLMTVTWFPCL